MLFSTARLQNCTPYAWILIYTLNEKLKNCCLGILHADLEENMVAASDANRYAFVFHEMFSYTKR